MNELQQVEDQIDNKSFFLIHRKTLTDVGTNIISGYDESKRIEKSRISEINRESHDVLVNDQLKYSHYYSKFGPIDKTITNGKTTNYPNKSCIIKSNSSGIKTTIIAYGDRLDYDIASIDSADVYATNDVNQISNFQFGRHSNITAFIGMNLINIAPEVFVGSYLIYVEIDGMQELPEECFAGSRSLEYVSLGTQLRSIPTGCFINCSKLVYIELPKSCTSIGAMAFRDCSKLRMIDGIEHVTSIGDDALSGTNVRYIEIGTGFTNRTNFDGSITRSNVEAVYVDNIRTTGDVFVNSCSKMNTVIVGSNVGVVETLAKNTEKFKEIIFEGIATTRISNTLVEGYSNLSFIHHPNIIPLDPNINLNMSFRLCSPTMSMRYYSPPNYANKMRISIFENVNKLEFLSVNTNNRFDELYLPNSVENVRIRAGECQDEGEYMRYINSSYFVPRIHYY